MIDRNLNLNRNRNTETEIPKPKYRNRNTETEIPQPKYRNRNTKTESFRSLTITVYFYTMIWYNEALKIYFFLFPFNRFLKCPFFNNYTHPPFPSPPPPPGPPCLSKFASPSDINDIFLIIFVMCVSNFKCLTSGQVICLWGREGEGEGNTFFIT